MELLKLYYFDFLKKINNKSLFNLCLFCLFVLFIIYRFSIILSYSSDIVIGEDNNVWNIQKMLSGKPLYTNPEDYPFEIFQYAPLSQYFTFYTSKILSFRVGENVHGIFVLGRIYSLLFNILTSIVIYRFNSVFLRISQSVNLLFSFVSLIIITYIDFTLRADSLSNFFIILSIFWFFKSLESDRIIYLGLTILFAVTAIFSKQSAIQVIVYFSSVYLFYKPRKLISYIFLLLLISIVFSFFFYLIYGRLFFYSTIVGISNPTELKLGISLFFDYTKRYGILLLFSILAFFTIKEDSKLSKYINILFFIFISSFIFSFGTSQKIGAGLNYYTLNIYISVILSAVLIDRILKQSIFQFKFLLLSTLLLFTTSHVFIERMYNRHLPQISLKHKDEYLIDVHFVKEVKKRIGIVNKQDYLFTPNKNIKNLYFYNTVLPNTEYYSDGGSHFKWTKFDKKKLKYIIINENDSYVLNNRTFHQFQIDLLDYDLLYEFKNRKLLCIKKHN